MASTSPSKRWVRLRAGAIRVARPRRAVGALIVAVIASPLLTGRDSLPLSTYPMYASKRESSARFVISRGVDASGRVVELSMHVQAATDDPLVARSSLIDAAGNPAVLRGVCHSILSRAPETIRVVVIADEVHDIDAAAVGDRSVVQSVELSRCEREL
jgi:hypothetical protein